MFEFGLGVILAVLFVAVYLLITSFFGRDRPEIEGLRQAVSLNPVDTSHALDKGRSRHALTSGESNRHDSNTDRDGAVGGNDSRL